MKIANVGFRMTEEEKNKLVQMAKELDIPLSQIVREALKLYYKEKEKKDV